MNKVNIIENIISFVGGSAVLLAVIAWLIRKLTESFLSKDLEKYKSDLRIEATKENVSFTRLHEKRGEAIQIIYSKMVNSIYSVEQYVNPVGTFEEKVRLYPDTIKVLIDFFTYFDKNRILLPSKLCENIEQAFKELKKQVYDLYSESQLVVNTDQDSNAKSMLKWLESWDKAQKGELISVRSELEKEFRSILGVFNN